MLETLKNIILDYVDVDPDAITEGASLRSDLGATSFDLMNIAVAVEETFGLTVSNEALTEMHCVGDMLRRIEAA